jgi:hypothetical protein
MLLVVCPSARVRVTVRLMQVAAHASPSPPGLQENAARVLPKPPAGARGGTETADSDSDRNSPTRSRILGSWHLLLVLVVG